jgi:biotin operon repressor
LAASSIEKSLTYPADVVNYLLADKIILDKSYNKYYKYYMVQDNKNLISAQEISKKFHISYQLVNYYTNIGLFSVCTNRGNQRLYDCRETQRIFKKIQELRRRGYPLRVIRQEFLRG